MASPRHPHLSASAAELSQHDQHNGGPKQTQRATKKRETPRYKHVLAVHKESKMSYLTQGSPAAPSFVGFRNLMVLVIAVSNLRLMIENFRKYGVLIRLSNHDYRRQDVIYGTLLFFLVPCHLFIAYLIELVAAAHTKTSIGQAKKTDSTGISSIPGGKIRLHHPTWWLIAIAHFLNATINLLFATIVVYYYIHHPGIGTLCEVHAVVVWLKTSSYALTNRDLRHAYATSTASTLPEIYRQCPYPRNISFNNLCYFWWAPTLVYQPVYPRTAHIRWSFVLKRIAEVFCLSIAIWIASAQYAAPLLQNSLSTISSLDFPSFLERLMKLSSISLFCWLAGFFALFQSALNALAEVMRFADREFYTDWWNSDSVRRYWSSWNRPVNQFMLRHVYMPLVARGCPVGLAQFLVFFFSATLHELLVGVPTHNIIGVAFAGMMLQLPLIYLTDAIKKIKGFDSTTAGNVIFWVSFVLVGQPLAAMLYFFAWQAKYGSASRPDFEHLWG